MGDWTTIIVGLVGTIVGGGAIGAVLTHMSMNRKHRRDDFTILVATLRTDNDELRKRIRAAENEIITMRQERLDFMKQITKMEECIALLNKTKQ